MLLKRKRSDDELSYFSSSGVGYSTPTRSDSGDTVMMDTEIHSPTTMLSPWSKQSNSSRSTTPSHLHSRTLKRLRNGRPSEAEVHQNTMKMLYQAQQHPQQAHQILTPPATASPMPSPPPFITTPSPKQQPSLHSFWKPIPATAPGQRQRQQQQQQQVLPISLGNRAPVCQECGVGLGEEDDAMMDDGGYGFETYINTCSACARPVCFSCSVCNLGEQRRCLRCAGRKGTGMASKEKKWMGGCCWGSGHVSVC